jgi:hypothetical protein
MRRVSSASEQDLFAKHYAMGKSGKQAAILAGYSLSLPFELIATFATKKSIDGNVFEKIRTYFKETC